MSTSDDDEKSKEHHEQDDVSPLGDDGFNGRSSGDLMFPQPVVARLTPEQRAWAAKDELPEAEIAARLKELREKGGLELYQFVQDLEQMVNPDGPAVS